MVLCLDAGMLLIETHHPTGNVREQTTSQPAHAVFPLWVEHAIFTHLGFRVSVVALAGRMYPWRIAVNDTTVSDNPFGVDCLGTQALSRVDSADAAVQYQGISNYSPVISL